MAYHDYDTPEDPITYKVHARWTEYRYDENDNETSATNEDTFDITLGADSFHADRDEDGMYYEEYDVTEDDVADAINSEYGIDDDPSVAEWTIDEWEILDHD